MLKTIAYYAQEATLLQYSSFTNMFNNVQVILVSWRLKCVGFVPPKDAARGSAWEARGRYNPTRFKDDWLVPSVCIRPLLALSLNTYIPRCKRLPTSARGLPWCMRAIGTTRTRGALILWRGTGMVQIYWRALNIRIVTDHFCRPPETSTK